MTFDLRGVILLLISDEQDSFLFHLYPICNPLKRSSESTSIVASHDLSTFC